MISVVAALSLASAALATYSNSTSYVYVSDIDTTVLTITNCGTLTCTAQPITTGVTTVTQTLNSTTTEYTTYCPLTSAVVVPLPTVAPPPADSAPAPAPPSISESAAPSESAPASSVAGNATAPILTGAANKFTQFSPLLGLVAVAML